MTICAIRSNEAALCEAILRMLPDWFGIEESLVQYVRDCERWPTWIAWDGANPIGFVTYRPHFPKSGEIHCLAVVPQLHRTGCGRALVEHVADHARGGGVQFLQVKTLGPSRPCEFYDRTRAFYEACGFVAIEEFLTLWPGNPCLMLIRGL